MWTGQGRAPRLPGNWRTIRRRVLERDSHQCRAITGGVRCTHTATDVDHIDPMADNHHPDALQSLCPYHHGQKSGREGGTASHAAWRQRRAKLTRPQRKHPGIK